MIRRSVFTSVGLFALLASNPVVSADEAAVSFAEQISPLLRQRCAVCHITGQEPGLISLVPARAYEELVGPDSVQSGLKRVEPGEPQASYLYHKLAGSHLDVGGEGMKMPFAAPALSDAQLDLVRRWIEQGAENN